MSQKLTSNDNSTKQTNSRRQFIVKTVVGSASLSVPGKSVWGACSVSGAMSGNVSRVENTHKCVAPTISGGRSPGSWKDTLDGAMNGQKIKAMFSILKKQAILPAAEVGSILLVAYEKHLEDVVRTHSMKIDRRVLSNDVIFVNGGVPLAAALGDPGGMDYNLAAVWLNVYFGFYPSIVAHDANEQERIDRANELVNNIAIYLFSEARIAMSSPASFGGTELVSFNYNFESEASTNYAISDPEDNVINRTTPHGLTDDNVTGDDSGNGN